MRRTAMIFCASIFAATGGAQDAEAPATTQPTMIAAPMQTITFADEGMERAASMLLGTWRSTEPIDDGSGSTIVMSVAAVTVPGLEGAMYAELARSEDLGMPYRQIMLQLYRFEGELRLRTLEFKEESLKTVLVGCTYVPDRFPETITADQLYATLDVDLTETADGFEGETPYPYPTTESGAVQMTSAIRLTEGSLSTGDTGFAADGSVAWGADGNWMTFSRDDGLVRVERWSDGLIEIQFSQGEGEPVQDGDTLALHYTGRLTDGSKFDSSRDRGQPFRYEVPGRLITGWLRGTDDIREGAQRRLIIPPELGYGPRANARIPANSTLIFDIECIDIERPDPQPETDDAGASNPDE